MHLLVWNQGFSPMFSAKELKNHVIYTYTFVCIENVCTSGEDGLPTCWGLLAQEMLRVRLVASHSLSLSPRCQAPTSQVENQAHTRTDSSWRAALARSSSCPSSHNCQLRPITDVGQWGKEGGESSRPRHAGILKQTGKGRIPARVQTAQGLG